jgi:hypothetical protein
MAFIRSAGNAIASSKCNALHRNALRSVKQARATGKPTFDIFQRISACGVLCAVRESDFEIGANHPNSWTIATKKPRSALTPSQFHQESISWRARLSWASSRTVA